VREQTTGEFAREQARLRLQLWALALARALKLPSEDNVHEMRVATRRLQSVLRTFGPVLGGTKGLRRRLKLAMDAAAEVRSCDIAEMLIGESKTAVPPRLLGRLAVERSRAETQMIETLRDQFPEAQETGARKLERRWQKKLGL
jgi:CHAD domain-containing protein